MQSTSMISVSPSFTAHSSNNIADIAARVVEEFRNENGDDDIYNDLIDEDEPNRYYNPAPDQKANENEADKDEDEEGEFEFAVVRTQSPSPVSADEIFSNGEILPRYPLFDRSLLSADDDVPPYFYTNSVKSDADFTNSKPVRVPLRKLFSEERERDYSPSCSSSEADDLDGITPGTYCIWKPKEVEESPERCKKSNSTGNISKRWKFRNLLLHRSNSDNHISAAGKDASSVVVISPVSPATKKRSEKVKKVEKTSKVAVADDDGDTTAMKPVIIENNPANKLNKGGNRLRSYLPYKQDLVGVFANVNGLSRNLHPF